jgi:hypothetical protein
VFLQLRVYQLSAKSRNSGIAYDTYQLLICTADFNLFAENINIVNAETLLDVNKRVGLEVNTEKTKCKFMSHYQTICRTKLKHEVS